MNKALSRSIAIDEMSAAPLTLPVSEDAGFGFRDLVSVLFSQRLVMLAILVLTMAAGILFVQRLPRMYFAQAQIALGASQGADAARTTNATGAPAAPDTALVESEMEVLKSNDLMIRLIGKLGPEFVAAKMNVGRPAAYANAAPESNKMRDLVQVLQGRLTVKREQTSVVISAGFSSPSPQTSVLLSNAIVDAYLESKADERLSAAQRASVWLNRRVETLAKEVETKEAAVAAYRAEMKLLSVDGATLDEQQYFKTQGEVVTARADLASKQARLAQAQQIAAAGGNAEASQEAVSSPTIQALRQRQAEIAGREAELKQKYLPTHPAVQQAMHEHDEVQQQITLEIKRITSSLGNEVDVARTRLRELETGLSGIEGNLIQGNRAIVRLKELERDAEASSLVYQQFLLRTHEIAEQESLKVVDAHGVSRAIAPPRPSSTSPTLWLAFFFAAGIFLALLGGILRSILNDRIIRPETIGRRIGVPALVSVPLINQSQLRKLPPDERTPEDYLVNKPMTAFAESLRVLGANLIADFDGGSGLSVAVTSAVASEGKTTVSISLGRAAAMSGLRVLIIDCDARRPSLSASIGDKPAVSLADVIKGASNWKEAAVVDPLSSALVLPINVRTGEMQSLFRPDLVRKLLNDVRADFDLIVMDCPPVLAVAETRWLTLVADTTIIVTRWNRTRTAMVRTATREILRAKGRVSGVVLNRIDVGMTKRFSFSDALYYGAAGKGYYST